MSKFDMIAFDADDTLWHNERLYVNAQTKFAELLSQYHKPEWVSERLYQTETQNIQHFGYGIRERFEIQVSQVNNLNMRWMLATYIIDSLERV